MSLVDEVLKRVRRVTREPLLPILKQQKVTEKKPPPEVPPEWWVEYLPPRRKAR